MLQTSLNSLTTQKMTDEHVQPDTFTPPLYTLPGNVRKSFNQLLEIFKLQFGQDETSLGTTYITKCKFTQGTQNLSCRDHTPSP